MVTGVVPSPPEEAEGISGVWSIGGGGGIEQEDRQVKGQGCLEELAE